jgi:hypothetical protein
MAGHTVKTFGNTENTERCRKDAKFVQKEYYILYKEKDIPVGG